MKAKLFKSFISKAEACEYVRNHRQSLIVVKRLGKFLAVLPEDHRGKLRVYAEGTEAAAKRCGLKPENYLLSVRHLKRIVAMKASGKNYNEIALELDVNWAKVRTIYKRYEEGMLEELME